MHSQRGRVTRESCKCNGVPVNGAGGVPVNGKAAGKKAVEAYFGFRLACCAPHDLLTWVEKQSMKGFPTLSSGEYGR